MADLQILDTIARQYLASLAMLGQAVELCPESLWTADEYRNKFWRIAYHALFYTHLYLQNSEADFHQWPKHRADYQYLGPRPWAPLEAPKIGEPYTKAEIREYHALCCAEVEERVPGIDLAAASGFSWLPLNKLELQLYNIRHIQHHTGQLTDRLRNTANVGVGWVRQG